MIFLAKKKRGFTADCSVYTYPFWLFCTEETSLSTWCMMKRNFVYQLLNKILKKQKWLDHRGKTKLIHASKNLHFSHYVRSKVPTVTQNTEFRCHSIPTPHGHTCACFQWPYTQNMQNLLLPYTLLVFSGYTHSLWCISTPRFIQSSVHYDHGPFGLKKLLWFLVSIDTT